MPRLVAAAAALRDQCEAARLQLASSVAHVYNPLAYAWPVHLEFIERYGGAHRREAVFVGMNPGPWGMLQTGVPFGDAPFVVQTLGIRASVTVPPDLELHPKRAIQGLDCPRREVSGSRLYGLAESHFGGIGAFFRRFWIVNFCPLAFFDSAGRNLTPAQLPASVRETVMPACDTHLQAVVETLRPQRVVGVGRFAEDRARSAVGSTFEVAGILHPSPASPAANRGWEAQVIAALQAMGIGATAGQPGQ